MGPRAWLALLLALAGGCGRSPLEIELPDVPGARAVAIAFERGANTSFSDVRVFAAEADRSGGLTGLAEELESTESLRITGLYYSSPLETLGMEAGPLEPYGANPTSLSRWSMVGARQIVVAEDSEPPLAWQEISELASPLAEWSYASALDPDCSQFDASPLRVETSTAHVSFALALEEGSVLVGTTSPFGWVEVQPDGTLDESEITTVGCPAGRRAAEGAFRPEGSSRFFLGGSFGEIWQVSKEGKTITCHWVSRTSTGETLRWISGSPTDHGLELFTLSIEGSFEHFDGQAWSVLHQFPIAGDTDEHGGVSWIGPDQAMAVRVVSGHLAHYDQGDTRLEELSVDAGLSTVAKILGSGVVVATQPPPFLRVLLRAEGERSWEELPQREDRSEVIGNTVGAIHPYEDGFLIGATQGSFAQYRPDTGFCPSDSSPVSIRTFANLGPASGDLVAVGPRPNTGSLRSVISLFRRR